MFKCCRNCANLIDYPKNNRYGDVNHLCIVTMISIIDAYRRSGNEWCIPTMTL